MKVYDIICEDQNLKEKPGSGMIGTALKKVGAKAAAKVGMSKTAGKLAGDVDISKRSKEIYKKFMTYLGRTAPDTMKNPNAESLIGFLNQENLPTARAEKLSGQLQPKQVDQLLTQIAQDSYRGKGDTGTKGAKAEPKTLGQEFGFADTDKDGVDDKTKQPMDPNKPKISPESAELINQIKKDPDLRKQFLAMMK